MSSLPSSMRAAHFKTASGGLDKNVYIESIPLPKTASSLAPNSVLIRVAYSSLNPVDFKVPESPAGHFFSKPLIPSSDYAGVVVKSSWDKFKEGDRVFGVTKTVPFGALTEYIIHYREKSVIKLPDEVSLKDASTIGVAGLTALQSLKPYVKAGDRVLINGASGGVGVFAIQVAKVLGCFVTAVCSEPNAKLCQSIGADEVLDYTASSLVGQLREPQRQPYDFILDCIFADPELYWQCHHYLKKDCIFATIAGSPTLKFLSTAIAIKTKPAFLGGGKRRFEFIVSGAELNGYETLAQWMAGGKIRAVIEQEYDLDQIAEAYTKLKSGRVKGKLVVAVAVGDSSSSRL